MDITYSSVKEKIGTILGADILDKDEMRDFYRQIELYNAHKVIANQDDRLMKDVEFLMRSAIFLMDVGNPGDWKLQLEAALGVLQNFP
jgi:hypothetical protein